MIQLPEPGQIIVEMPGRGAIVGFASYLQGRFDNLLAPGSVVDIDGARGVDWRIDGFRRLDRDDPRATRVAAQLQAAVARVRISSDELGRLVGPTQGADKVRLHKGLVASIGGRGDQDAIMPREEVEHLYNLNRLAADAVARAVDRGDLYTNDEKVLLIGWAFLPPSVKIADRVIPVAVSLKLEPDESVDGAVVRVLSWRTAGPAVSVELLELTTATNGASTEHPIPYTVTPVVGDPASGLWRFSVEHISAGTRLKVAATGPMGVVRSAELQIPHSRDAQPWGAVAGSTPARDTDPSAPAATIPMAAPVEPTVVPVAAILSPRRRVSSRVWLLLLALLLLLLLIMLWYYLPARPIFARSGEPLTAVHLPIRGATAVRATVATAGDVRVVPEPEAKPADSGAVIVTPVATGVQADNVRVVEEGGDQTSSALGRVIPTYVEEAVEESPTTSVPAVSVPQRRLIPDFIEGASPSTSRHSIRFMPSLPRWRRGTASTGALAVGVEIVNPPASLIEWANTHGMPARMRSKVDGSDAMIFTIDPPALVAQGETVRWNSGALSVTLAPGSVTLEGFLFRPVIVADRTPSTAAGPCTARLIGIDPAVQSWASLVFVPPLQDAAGLEVPDVWRVQVGDELGQQDIQFSACDGTKVCERFTIASEAPLIGGPR